MPHHNIHGLNESNGKFLQPPTAGNSYILVVYDYDVNCIDAISMPNRKGPTIIAAYNKSLTLLESQGVKLLLQHLENEASQALQSFMAKSNTNFQLAPPQVQHRNATE
jgi:hypothetical protein